MSDINFPYFVLRGKAGDAIYFKQAKVVESDKYKMIIQAKLGTDEANFNIINAQCCVTPNHFIRNDISVITKTDAIELTVQETLTFEYENKINKADYYEYKKNTSDFWDHKRQQWTTTPEK